jgi:ubiquinone/menaquinone biosynthesis C-methylase UbiE
VDDSTWHEPSTVAGFATGPPNTTLIDFARLELTRATTRRALDIGCGAGRNAVPLAASGWSVVGVDRSMPMLKAARDRRLREASGSSAWFALAAMHQLPLADRSCDLIVAHGIWNLARTGREFRAAVAEAGRVARPGAVLFLFTFSRTTLPPGAAAIPGESFVFTQFQHQPHCFLSKEQLLEELGAAGFAEDSALVLRELNARRPGMLAAAGAPVIWEGAFRFE